MFKFFRQYQQYFLVVGVTLLMIVFLIEGAMLRGGMGRGGIDISGEPAGKLRGETLTVGDRQSASLDLHVLGSLNFLLIANTQDRETEAASAWMLMLKDAEAMGISASEYDASIVLQAVGINDEEATKSAAERLRVTPAAVRQAARHYAIIRQYRALTLGVRLEPLSTWAQNFLQLTALINEDRFSGDPRMAQYRMFMLQRVAMEMNAHDTQARTSKPLAERFMSDAQARVKITAVAVPAESLAADASEPDAAALQTLFDKYKGRLPGDATGLAEEDPRLGYRFPDRVKIEYLSIASAALKRKARVDESEALKLYNDRKQVFRNEPNPASTQPSTQPLFKPYEEVRSLIIDALREQKAEELGDRMMKAAQAMLAHDARALKEADNYREVPADWAPMALSQVAAKLQEQFGVLPEVVRVEDRWLDRDALAKLNGIGSAILPIGGNRSASLAEYVMSARELAPKSDDPLISLRLQVKLPSQALLGGTGDTRYLFRLTAAEAARSPEKLDEVRDQVMRDARRVAAFAKLREQKDKLLARLSDTDVDKLAKELKGKVITPPEFSRRTMGARGEMSVPNIEEIGESLTFVQAVMDAAEANTKSLAVPVPANLTLYLVRIDKFSPLRRDEIDTITANPLIAAGLYDKLMGRTASDPFSYESLSKRLKFEPAHPEKDAKKDDAKKDEAKKPAAS